MDSEAPGLQARGDYFLPHSSQPYPALLTIGLDGGLRLADAEGREIAGAGVDTVEISPRVGKIPRRIRFGDGSLFVTPDNDAIDLLDTSRKGKRAARVHRLEKFRSHLAIFVIGVALLAAGIYRYALPLMIELAVAVTPPAVPNLLGAGTIDMLDRTLLTESGLDPERRAVIAKEFDDLAAFSDAGSVGYALKFRGGGLIGPNAFALPDGTIILTDELVELAADDDMILGVLAHEIGHVEKQHSLRQLYRFAGMSALVMLIAGDVGEAVQDAMAQGTALLSLSYSRESEREADRRSVELMRKAGKDPLAINAFFRLIEEKLGGGDDSGILSTHPATADRAAALENYVRSLEESAVTAD